MILLSKMWGMNGQTTPTLTVPYRFEDLCVGDRVDRFDNIAREVIAILQREGLYEADLRYRGFSASRIPTVQATGTDRDQSEIWYGDAATSDLDPARVLYATKEGARIEKRTRESWDHLEDAIASSVSRANQEGVSAISVYRGNDLVPTRQELGEYLLRTGAMPKAIITLQDTSVNGTQ